MRTLRYLSFLCVLVIASASLSGCNAKPEALIGKYSVEQNGKVDEFIRVEKRNDKFVFLEKHNRHWLPPAEVEELDDVDLERILGQQIPSGYTALGNEMVAVLKVKKGWKLDSFESHTGYVLASRLGPMDLYQDAK